MEKIAINPKKYVQLGQIEKDLGLLFRKQCAERKFKQSEVIKLLIDWWISLDEGSQRNFYYQESDPLPDNIRAAIDERVNKILTDYKLIAVPEPDPKNSAVDSDGLTASQRITETLNQANARLKQKKAN